MAKACDFEGGAAPHARRYGGGAWPPPIACRSVMVQRQHEVPKEVESPASARRIFAELRAGGPSNDFGRWGALDHEDVLAEFLKAITPLRRRVAEVLLSGSCEFCLTMVILGNFAVAIAEANATSNGEDAPRWIFVTNSSLLCVYCIELSARLFVFRRYFFFSPWHLLDFTIIGVDVALLILQGLIGDLPNLAVLRILRLVRLARAVRTFPELRTMMLGLAGTVKTVFWGILLLGAIIIFFSLVAVQLVHPINSKLDYDGCERCPRAYQSVWYAFCTLVQQVVAGDAWGTATLPVIEEAPWAFLFFFGILVTVNLLVINLILAVIVEKAQEVHEQQTQEVVKRQAAKKEVEVKKAKIELCKLCYAMDEDKSGNLTLDELLKGYDGNGYFANLLKSMDITRDDLKMVFNILDKDSSGDVDYAEFVDQLHRLKSQDEHTLLIFIMHYVKECQVTMLKQRLEEKEMEPRWITQALSGLDAAAEATSMPLPGRKAPSTPAEINAEIAELAILMDRARKTSAAQAKLIEAMSASFNSIIEADVTEI